MNKKEKQQLLKMYDLLQDELEFHYEQENGALKITELEGKIEQMKAVMTVLSIPFEE